MSKCKAKALKVLLQRLKFEEGFRWNFWGQPVELCPFYSTGECFGCGGGVSVIHKHRHRLITAAAALPSNSKSFRLSLSLSFFRSSSDQPTHT